ncbi:MAG TPA: trypsin-like peptidase domain-containing protein [Pirellulales bacterium]|nr:trypsin-like peptidase domain-containing protein [Pirellulales bacterium]
MNFAYLAAAMISLAAPGDSQRTQADNFELAPLGNIQPTHSDYAPSGGAAANEDTLLLDFRADWCGPCRQMDPVVGSILAAGYPVRRVNIDQERELANRFGVTGIPCFVMVVHGREVDRVVGVTDRSRLEAMFSRNGVGPQVNASRGQSPGGIGLLSGGGIPFPPTQPSSPDQNGFFGSRFRSHPDTFARGDDFPGHDPRDAGHTDDFENQSSTLHNRSTADGTSVPDAYEPLLRASVRLRIEDETGISRGSGTIVDARSGEALIITCGHMFREAAKNGKIWVDLFGPEAPQGVPGKLVDYDLKSEVGLIRIATRYPVTAARLAPPGYMVRTGDKVISMGCDGGADATAKETHVTSINRYVGAANLQVAFQPVQGRSGGGLFTPEGWVVGVCYAADPEASEGLFTALPALCEELDHVGLSFVYREPAASGQVASNGRPQPPRAIETTQLDSQTQDGGNRLTNGGNVMFDRQLQPANQLQPVGVTTTALSDRNAAPAAGLADRSGQQLSPDEKAALDAIRHETQGADVVCIVRPQGNAQAESEIIVLNHASPALLEQLTAAQQSQGVQRR